MKLRLLAGLAFLSLVVGVPQIMAAPYFSIEGSDIIYGRQVWYYYIYLHTDGQTLSAAHATLSVDTSLYEQISFSQANSVCDVWAPPDPSVLNTGASTPFVQSNTVYMSCGFTQGGHATATGNSDGDLFLTLKLLPDRSILGPISRTFAFDNELFQYIGTTIAPGVSVDFDYKIATSSTQVQPTPTVTPTPPPPDTLTADELLFTEIGINKNSVTSSNRQPFSFTQLGAGTQTLNTSLLNQLSRDDSIPPPPDMTPRPPVTPYGVPDYEAATKSGDVLSVQSLRELLLPGVSEADSRVVFFNLVMSILFIIILALLIWRLHESRKLGSLQKRHIHDLLTGELSMLENKFGFKDDIKTDEFVQQLKQIKNEMNED